MRACHHARRHRRWDWGCNRGKQIFETHQSLPPTLIPTRFSPIPPLPRLPVRQGLPCSRRALPSRFWGRVPLQPWEIPSVTIPGPPGLRSLPAHALVHPSTKFSPPSAPCALGVPCSRSALLSRFLVPGAVATVGNPLGDHSRSSRPPITTHLPARPPVHPLVGSLLPTPPYLSFAIALDPGFGITGVFFHVLRPLSWLGSLPMSRGRLARPGVGNLFSGASII